MRAAAITLSARTSFRDWCSEITVSIRPKSHRSKVPSPCDLPQNTCVGVIQTQGRNRVVASELGIRERTVKAHLYHICYKTGLDS
jgi:hypothetical protein